MMEHDSKKIKEPEDQEYRIPDASLILIKSIPIALFIVLVTLGIVFVIITLMRW